jgi:transcriptional regulator with XRE-family HTH domain
MRAGVSTSILSEVERNQADPTVGVLWRPLNMRK